MGGPGALRSNADAEKLEGKAARPSRRVSWVESWMVTLVEIVEAGEEERDALVETLGSDCRAFWCAGHHDGKGRRAGEVAFAASLCNHPPIR